MKIYPACLMFFLIGIFPAFAQDQPPSAEEIVSKMQTKLSLTEDQVTAVTPIVEKYSSKREQLRQSMEDGTADQDSIHAQMKQLKDAETQELCQVLSADQLSQWKKMMARRMHNGPNGGANGPARQ